MSSKYQREKSAVLLINLGSPEAPTASALRVYLAEFLSDFRVVDLPRWQWLPILHAIVLRFRPKQSAKLYKSIWTEEGSPLIVNTERQVAALQARFLLSGHEHIIVDYAMRYGNPSIEEKISNLKAQGVNQILVLPMYPQYCDATTASVIDGVAVALRKMRYMPEWRFVHHWHEHPLYIRALAQSVSDYIAEKGMPEKLLISFHGVPKRTISEGDPYLYFCQRTTQLLLEQLGLNEDIPQLVFQSQFGWEEWLRPYAVEEIEALAKAGVKKIAVLCPGFSADCLETLEEMAKTNKKVFLENGGEVYDYIPALNDSPWHIDLLMQLIFHHTQDWASFASLAEKSEGSSF